MVVPWFKPQPAAAQTAAITPVTVISDGFFITPHPLRKPLKPLTTVEAAPLALVKVARPPVAGNTYYAGQCTWYAKDRRPDLPNNLGNADTWADRAAAQGWRVDGAPEVGDIGMTRAYMHVVYVEAVNGDGSVTISEMNFVSEYVVSTRTAPVSEFIYIHQ